MADIAKAPAIPQYDAMRRRLQGQFTQKKQETSDAIQRRFAANGMGMSGAYGKTQDKAANEMAVAESDATAQLDLAEANEAQRRVEVAEGRGFAKSEREASQSYATGERVASQGFASGERQATQGFARSEREAGQIFNKDLFDRDMRFKESTRDLDNLFREKEFGESVRANRLNSDLAEHEAGLETGGDYDKFLSRKYGASWRNR